jgi:hypothetical protein
MYLTTDTEKACGQNTDTILGSIVDMKFLLGEGGGGCYVIKQKRNLTLNFYTLCISISNVKLKLTFICDT